MALRVEKRDGTGERQVLIGMLVSRAVLGPIAARWERGLFPSRWGELLAGWAVAHYTKYKKPPGRDIVGYFDAWAETQRDAETVEIIESLLSGLSEEYERLKQSVSPDYLLDVAARLFNRNRLVDLRQAIEADLEGGDVDRAQSRIGEYRKIEIGTGAGIEVLSDEEAIVSAFEKRGEALVSYPDAAGNFFGPALCRDAFIAWLAKEKGGKSFALQDMAWRAVEQSRNVAYFEVGDMSEHQVLRRLAVRACGRPLEAGRYEYPTDIEPWGGKGLPEVKSEYREEKKPLSPEAVTAEFRRVSGRVGPDRFKISCHPNSSISVAGVEEVLAGWERDGWAADVVIVDYADILAPLDNRADTRDQINATWKALRALSQRRHCLVVTATQADAASYTAQTLSRDNFSEDKRKFAHVTGMVGINQTDKEKDRGLFRLNWVVLRELEFSEQKCVWMAGCLAVGNPCLHSTF